MRFGVIVLLVVAPALAPPAQGDHCESAIVVYGRTGSAPGVVPPSSGTRAPCLKEPPPEVDPHQLAPGTDAILVRVETDLGPHYRKLPLQLDGLGWRGQTFSLERSRSVAGGHVYGLADWLSIPDAAHENKTLRATVSFPGGHDASVTYRLAELPDAPSAPTESGRG